MLRSTLFAFVLAATAGACAPPATTFEGSAVVQGPHQCLLMCERNQLQFAGMVFMGEYSSGCICRAPSAPGAVAEDSAAFAVAAAPAAIGVVMQMRAIEEAAEELQRQQAEDEERRRREQEEEDRRQREQL